MENLRLFLIIGIILLLNKDFFLRHDPLANGPAKDVHNFLHGARVYLAGPMDFVASRESERQHGWRGRVKAFLEALDVTVFDPWEKPQIRGLFEYGKEDIKTIRQRDKWTFEPGAEGSSTRAELAEYFWDTMHIDLRMVDISDFVIAYCPTNIYSVGTVHEIVVARSQHKPVLFISPAIEFPALGALKQAVAENAELSSLLETLESEIPIRENPSATPSLWYLPLIGSESFFDGFGFQQPQYLEQFTKWRQCSPLDERELKRPPKRPLLPFLEELGRGTSVPRRWVHATGKYQDDDDWLLLAESLKK
jgi:hypothetical protein